MEPARLPDGPFPKPLEPVPAAYARLFADWETPLAPLGGFNSPAGIAVERDETVGRQVMAFILEDSFARSLVLRHPYLRDGRITAVLKPLQNDAVPNMDRDPCSRALVGPIFRRQTSRAYYQFAIEGMERAVVYRRSDDEWVVLAAADIDLPDTYITLEVLMDGDSFHCRIPELGIQFHCTDTAYRMGKVGVRALGRAKLASFAAAQTPSQQERDRVRRALFAPHLTTDKAAGADLPDPVLRETIDLKRLGGSPLFRDLVEPGRYDMLIRSEAGLELRTVAGERLWTYPEKLDHMVFSQAHGPSGRLIYGFTGERSARQQESVRGEDLRQVIQDEMVVLQGADGKELARRKIPPMPPRTRHADFSPTSARFSGSEGTDIVLREWRDDKQGGGVRLWAYDQDLNLLWKHEQTGAWYGHHYALAVVDVDQDGRDELLAGGIMYDGDGSILWEHDLSDEFLQTYGGMHYDAVSVVTSTEGPEPRPCAHLIAGSGGVYVVDALTGETLAQHRQGHAQGQIRRSFDLRTSWKFRDDLPDEQVLVYNRWGNYGIMSLYSARGERLWTIQPDYIPGGSGLRWGERETHILLKATTPEALGFYDGRGRRVKELPQLRSYWDGRMPRAVGTRVIRMGLDETDLLALTCDGQLHIFGPGS